MSIGTYETHDLIKVVTTFRSPTSYWLELAFPTAYNSQDEFIDFDIVDEGRRLAPFVAPTAQGVPMKQDGYSTRKFKPAYSKMKDMVDPSRLLKRRAGEAFAGNLTPAQREQAIIADILRTHRNAIERRWEWMAAEAVINGAVTVKGDNYPEVSVSFGRAGTNTKALTGGTRWSETTAKPLEDIENWMTEMHQLCGYTPSRITMGLAAWRSFIKHADVKAMLETRRGSQNTIETGPGMGLPFQKRGELDSSGLEIWTYNDIYENDAGVAQSFLNTDTIVLTSPAIEGVRAFGAIMDRKAQYQAVPFFPKMYESEDPSGLFLLTQSAPLMIPTRPNASMSVKVNGAS